MFAQKTYNVNLTIDIGNTQVKYALFSENKIIESGIVLIPELKFYLKLIERVKIDRVIISNVGESISSEIIKLFSDNGLTIIEFDNSTAIPFKNLYKTPLTLGKDRIAAVAGAAMHYPNENLLVIDAGTAITYDFINKNGDYLGGNISLGINMRFKALNTFTKRLPLVEPSLNFNLIGTTSEEAILNGVLNGIIKEVDGIIYDFQENYADLRVVFTGGDTYFFDAKLKSRIFAHSNLVFEGLNCILEYNAK